MALGYSQSVRLAADRSGPYVIELQAAPKPSPAPSCLLDIRTCPGPPRAPAPPPLFCIGFDVVWDGIYNLPGPRYTIRCSPLNVGICKRDLITPFSMNGYPPSHLPPQEKLPITIHKRVEAVAQVRAPTPRANWVLRGRLRSRCGGVGRPITGQTDADHRNGSTASLCGSHEPRPTARPPPPPSLRFPMNGCLLPCTR